MALARGIEDAKRPGYTRGDADVLANFKNVAKSAKVTPEQAWAVYFLKHVDAITTHMTQPDLPISEAMEQRFADALNYLKLGYALFRERGLTLEQEEAILAIKRRTLAYNDDGA